MVSVKIKLINFGKKPHYKREGDACMDCYANTDDMIEAGTRKTIPLGFALELPENWEGQIRPRSGLSAQGIDIALGTIDSNYRGEVMATIINRTPKDFLVQRYDRICQLSINPVNTIEFEEVEELTKSDRGSNGFGSSGIR